MTQVSPQASPNGQAPRADRLGWSWGGALRGVVPPLLTPLTTAGGVDGGALGALIDHVLGAGCSGLFALGGCGAGPWHTAEDRRAAVRAAVRAAAGRAPVLVGVVLPATRPAVAAARQAADEGADAVVVGSPYYFDVDPAAQGRHVDAILGAVPLPALLYNIPQCTHRRLLPETVAALAAEPRILGLKDSAGDFPAFLDFVAIKTKRPGFKVLQGNELLMAPSLQHGGDGLIPGLANVDPALFVALRQAAAEEDADTCRRLQARIRALKTIEGHGGWLAALHAAGAHLGVGGGRPAGAVHPGDRRAAGRNRCRPGRARPGPGHAGGVTGRGYPPEIEGIELERIVAWRKETSVTQGSGAGLGTRRVRRAVLSGLGALAGAGSGGCSARAPRPARRRRRPRTGDPRRGGGGVLEHVGADAPGGGGPPEGARRLHRRQPAAHHGAARRRRWGRRRRTWTRSSPPSRPGLPPDLINNWPYRLADLFAKGGTVDVDAELKGNAEWRKVRETIYPHLLPGFTWKGKLFGVPTHNSFDQMYYSPEALKRVGLAAPPPKTWTWEQFTDHSRRGRPATRQHRLRRALDVAQDGPVGAEQRRQADQRGRDEVPDGLPRVPRGGGVAAGLHEGGADAPPRRLGQRGLRRAPAPGGRRLPERGGRPDPALPPAGDGIRHLLLPPRPAQHHQDQLHPGVAVRLLGVQARGRPSGAGRPAGGPVGGAAGVGHDLRRHRGRHHLLQAHRRVPRPSRRPSRRTPSPGRSTRPCRAPCPGRASPPSRRRRRRPTPS